MTSSGMVSTWQHGSKPWPSPAAFVLAELFATRCVTGSITSSRTWARRASRTLRDRCGFTKWEMSAPSARTRQPRPCLFQTSRRSQCCRFRISAATRSRSTSPMGWSKRLLLRCRAFVGCLSSRAIRALRTGKTVGVKQVGRELGVRYVLEGSVRKGRSRVRITAQLIDALSGTHLWADHFDGSLEDVFDLQDNVALSVVGVIEPTLEAAETRRSSHRPTGDVTAYDLYLQAREERYSFERNRVVRALGLLKQAIARDPGYAPALALGGMCHLAIVLNNWTDDLAVNQRHAVRLARRALQSGADDPVVLTDAGLLLGYFGEDIDAALRLVDRALALNPSYAHGWDTSGWLHVFAGHTEVAIPHFVSSLSLDPRGRRGLALSGIGVAHFFNKQFQEALERLVLSLEELPTFFPTYRVLAACYAPMVRLT